MDIGGIDSNIQALQAIGVDQAVRANNVANMSTEGFDPSSVHLETGPEGQGVRVAAILKEADSNPLMVMNGEPVEGSGTDLVRDMVGMMENQNAYAANTAMIRSWDETTGLLVNLKA